MSGSKDYLRKLSNFDRKGYNKGRNYLIQALWFGIMNVFFMKWWLPQRFRPPILRMFGATIGKNVLIRHRVRVLWPWKLEVGDHCWLGEDLWLLNLEQPQIGDDVCLSQGVMICTGSHDYKSAQFSYRNAPIRIESGVWLAAQTLVLPGVTIGQGATILARATIKENVPPGTIIRD